MRTIFKGIVFFVCFSFLLPAAKAQIVSGIGIMGGITYSTQKWKYTEPAEKLKKKWILRYNGSAFVEFFQHDYLRWVLEAQYNMKGAKEKTDTGTYRNKLDYICLNNYLKIRIYDELADFIPYIMLGVRSEYAFKKKPQIYPEIIQHFNPIHFGWSVGAGVEMVMYGNIKPFAELHYNRDLPVIYAYQKDNLSIINQAFELKVGFKYEFFKRKNCPRVYK